MARNPLTRSVLALLLLTVLVSGCGGGRAPTAAPTAPAGSHPVAGSTPTGVPGGTGRTWTPQMDLRPVIDDFLANVPAAWGLLPAQAVIPKKTILVDVRQPEEYQQGFIEDAVNIPLRELTRSLGALPAKDKEVVLVCDTGVRSAVGMVVLQMLGWKQAKSLYAGMKGWQEAKQPVVTSPAPKRPANPQPNVDAALLATLDGYLNQGLPQDYGRITPEVMARAMAQTPFEELIDPEVWAQGPPFLIDVSEPTEFAKGSLDKAINMPFRSIPSSLAMIPWKTPTIVVCGVENQLTTLDRTYKYIVTICPNGHRSAVAMVIFQMLGFRDVHALDGGIKAWNAATK